MEYQLYITSNSLNRSDCEKQYKTVKTLGKGVYRTIYEACRNNNCEYILKVIIFDKEKYLLSGSNDMLSKNTFMKNWKEEVINHAIIMNCENKYNVSSSIAPTLYDAWYCDEKDGNTIFYILMEKYEGNLYDFIKKYKNMKFLKTIINLALNNLTSTLYFIHQNCNICLNDIKLENILYKKNRNDIYEFVFSDFGLSSKNTDINCKQEDFKRFRKLVDTMKKEYNII